MSCGSVGVNGDGTDLAIVSYANGFDLSSQAEKVLREQHDIACRIIDIRWLAPLPEDVIVDATAGCNHVLIVDECRSTGSQGEALMTLFAEKSNHSAVRLVAKDSFIPTGPPMVRPCRAEMAWSVPLWRCSIRKNQGIRCK